MNWDRDLNKAAVHRICDIQFAHHSELKLSGPLLQCPSEYRWSSSSEMEGPSYFFIPGSNDSSFTFTWYQDKWFDSTVEEYLTDMTRPSTPKGPQAALQYREDTLAQGVRVTDELSGARSDTPSSTSRSSSPKQWIQDNRAKAFLGNILITPILCYVEDPEDEDKDEDFSQKGTVMGLLLHPLPGANPGVYRRVGIVEAEIRGDDKMNVHIVQRRFEAYRQPLDPQLFQEEDRYGNYVVTVF